MTNLNRSVCLANVGDREKQDPIYNMVKAAYDDLQTQVQNSESPAAIIPLMKEMHEDKKNPDAITGYSATREGLEPFIAQEKATIVNDIIAGYRSRIGDGGSAEDYLKTFLGPVGYSVDTDKATVKETGARLNVKSQDGFSPALNMYRGQKHMDKDSHEFYDWRLNRGEYTVTVKIPIVQSAL